MNEKRRAFLSELCHECDGDLRNFLRRRLSSADEAADAVQDTYERVLRLVDPDSIRNPRAFLLAIASNVAIDVIKRRGNFASLEGVFDATSADFLEQDPSVEAAADAHRRLEAVQSAVASLPARCREAFLLRKVDGKTYAEIAGEMNLSVSMVEKYVAQAMYRLERRLRNVLRLQGRGR